MSVHRSHIIVYRTGTNRVGTIIMSQALVDVNWIEVLGTASKRFKNKNLVMGLTFVWIRRRRMHTFEIYSIKSFIETDKS